MNKNSIQVDILSDLVCPWCVIGYKRLQQAIKQLGIGDQIEIHWHPFELNPQMPDDGENLREHLAAKYGTTLNGSIAARQRLTELGAAVGFNFNYFDEMRMFNTRKAHLLMQLAEQQGKQTVMAEALFKAYFSDQKNISNDDSLLSIAAKLGIDSGLASEYLNNPAHERQLVAQEQQWIGQGFQAVPMVIFNNRRLVSGAQEVENYRQALSEAMHVGSRYD